MEGYFQKINIMNFKSKEMKLNEYITLKLEKARTNIYINNKLFSQCKYLLLGISKKNLKDYDEINSIDEAAELLDRSMERNSSNFPEIASHLKFVLF